MWLGVRPVNPIPQPLTLSSVSSRYVTLVMIRFNDGQAGFVYVLHGFNGYLSLPFIYKLAVAHLSTQTEFYSLWFSFTSVDFVLVLKHLIAR